MFAQGWLGMVPGVREATCRGARLRACCDSGPGEYWLLARACKTATCAAASCRGRSSLVSGVGLCATGDRTVGRVILVGGFSLAFSWVAVGVRLVLCSTLSCFSRVHTKAGAVSHEVCDVFRDEPRLSEHDEMLLGSVASGGRRRRWRHRNISGELHRGIRLPLAPAFRKCPPTSSRLMPWTTKVSGLGIRHSRPATDVPMARFTESW